MQFTKQNKQNDSKTKYYQVILIDSYVFLLMGAEGLLGHIDGKIKTVLAR